MSSEGWGVSRGRGTESRPLRQRLKQSPHSILAASSWKATFPENSIVFQIFYGEKMFSWEKYSVGALKLWKSEGVKSRTQAGSHIWFQKRQFLQFTEVDFQGFTVTGLWNTVTGSLQLDQVPLIGFRKNTCLAMTKEEIETNLKMWVLDITAEKSLCCLQQENASKANTQI